MFFRAISAAAVFAAGVSAHGRVTSPTPRPLGNAMLEACGQQVFNQMSADPNGNIQTMANTGASQSDFSATACHLWQCRGYQFADSTSASIQNYTAGEIVDFTVAIVAPHTGVANVSVINLAENSVIGSPLVSWTDYASTATGVKANQTSFSVTIPSDLPSVCATAGGCALQWWWDARSIDQTYMSCVDFTTGSSGSTSSSGSSSSSSSSSSSTTVTSSTAKSATSSSTEPVGTTATSVATTTAIIVASSSSASDSAVAVAAAIASSVSCPADPTVTVTVSRSSSFCTPKTKTVTITVTA